MATKHLLNRVGLYPTFDGLTWVLLFTITALFTACIRPDAQNANSALPIIGQPHGEGNELFVGLEGDALQIDIRSATGIGRATLTMTTDLPITATIRLHLTGLEHLQLSNGVTTLVAQVSSQGDHAISQGVAVAPTAASAAEPITRTHPLWLTIEPHNATTLYYTVILPPAFLAEINQTLTIEWVDFYR